MGSRDEYGAPSPSPAGGGSKPKASGWGDLLADAIHPHPAPPGQAGGRCPPPSRGRWRWSLLPVILFPAIDLKDGLAVRLEQGDMARATVFNRDPAQQAHAFETQGFRHLHVVDLDAAFAGKPMNVTAVERILETRGLCVQPAGGIPDMKAIDGWPGEGRHPRLAGTGARARARIL